MNLITYEQLKDIAAQIIWLNPSPPLFWGGGGGGGWRVPGGGGGGCLSNIVFHDIYIPLVVN